MGYIYFCKLWDIFQYFGAMFFVNYGIYFLVNYGIYFNILGLIMSYGSVDH